MSDETDLVYDIDDIDEVDCFQSSFDKMETVIENAIKDAGHEEYYVMESFLDSREECSSDEDYLGQLSKVAISGKCRFVDEGDYDQEEFISDVIENPTYLQILIIANAMIIKTGDHHHCFLEGFEIDVNEAIGEDGVTNYHFIMGS